MTIEIALLISIVSVCFSVYFGLRNNKRSDTADLETRVRERTETNMKLDEIGRNVNEIKDSLKETKRDIQNLTTKVALVDQKADKANLRIDILEGKTIPNVHTTKVVAEEV